MIKVLILAVLSLLLYGCSKNNNDTPACTDVSVSLEEPQIINFCHDKGINYTKDPSGIYFQIIESGTDIKPTINSRISFTFTAKFLNDTLLSQITTPYTESMTNLIEGWQIGLQLIGKSGRIKLVVPSSLAYGCNGAPPGIPPNTILYYDITLVNVL